MIVFHSSATGILLRGRTGFWDTTEKPLPSVADGPLHVPDCYTSETVTTPKSLRRALPSLCCFFHNEESETAQTTNERKPLLTCGCFFTGLQSVGLVSNAVISVPKMATPRIAFLFSRIARGNSLTLMQSGLVQATFETASRPYKDTKVK